ncbi:hypothetical protein PVK06_025098 [Gossypium arboreum]|uniref:Uncharacterized protein n=1 Tax=Gossypium arboreum TaxID=29729 RepID=A0ABR0PFH3_GOSAR|nr:hypothetical protein PVK06_025098 [Gossypium arboreum]
MPSFPLKTHSSKKISYLYEATYLRGEEKVQPTELPTVNPYSTYKKTTFSPVKSIKSLIQHSPKQVQEYVQASRFDSHLISGDSAEKFVNLEIPPEFPKEWADTGYTHIHFGAIRLALNYHGAEGLKRKVIESFTADGKQHYMFKDPEIGYCLWALDDRLGAWIGNIDHSASKPGKPTKVSAAEAALNWQTENAIAQNRALKKLDSKVSHLDIKVSIVEEKLDDNSKIVKDLIVLLQRRLKEVARETAAPGQDFFSHIAQRDKEIQKLKDRIKTLKETGQIPSP